MDGGMGAGDAERNAAADQAEGAGDVVLIGPPFIDLLNLLHAQVPLRLRRPPLRVTDVHRAFKMMIAQSLSRGAAGGKENRPNNGIARAAGRFR